MKRSLDYQLKRLMLPGLKRWILIILVGISVIVIGVLLMLGFHPITVTGMFIREVLEHFADVLPYSISGIILISLGVLVICLAMLRVTQSVLGAYLPEERESIPDVLYRRRHLDSGARVVVVGGGTGLSTLLMGLKTFTNNITAIVTVGDDGGSSGRLRDELGVLPPGDIRNCITALADEDRLVTELFHYRFDAGEGLEGHSFGNLFLTALCSMTNGDIVEAVRVAGKVLNSCGQVLPSTLTNLELVAHLEDGRVIHGESNIPVANGRIKRLSCEPDELIATPEAVEAILNAELIVLGPGSLFTSIVPNLLIPGIRDAIKRSNAKRIYVCNVVTQLGETTNLTATDHVEAILSHSDVPLNQAYQLLDAVLVNDQKPLLGDTSPAKPVVFDPERLVALNIPCIRLPLVSEKSPGHHDSTKLAKSIMLWYLKAKRKKSERGALPVEEKNEKVLQRLASFFF